MGRWDWEHWEGEASTLQGPLQQEGILLTHVIVFPQPGISSAIPMGFSAHRLRGTSSFLRALLVS